MHCSANINFPGSKNKPSEIVRIREDIQPGARERNTSDNSLLLCLCVNSKINCTAFTTNINGIHGSQFTQRALRVCCWQSLWQDLPSFTTVISCNISSLVTSHQRPESIATVILCYSYLTQLPTLIYNSLFHETS